jgi:hypothetical protein
VAGKSSGRHRRGNAFYARSIWLDFLRSHSRSGQSCGDGQRYFVIRRQWRLRCRAPPNHRRELSEGTRYFCPTGIGNKNKQPIYDWALLNQAVAALLDQQDSIMHQALHEVENAGTNNFADPSLGAFLLDIAKRANARSTVALSDVPNHAAKPFALFLLGLTDVQLGRFNDAEALLTSFVGSQPPQTLSWIGEYKPIARKYLADSQDILKWREQYGSAKTITEMSRALSSLQDLIGRLQKNTAISAEALLSQKTLAARLRDAEAANKSPQGKQRRDSIARETPHLIAAMEAYRQLIAKYDFAGAAVVIRKVNVTEPSLRQMQSNYQNAAAWLAEWKATLIKDLNAHTYNGAVVVNDTQYSGIAGATADKLRMKVPYGVAEMNWLKVPCTDPANDLEFLRH